jgi:hypothetical protein
MLFKLSCLIGIGLALADGSTAPFWAIAGVIVTFSDKALRVVLWFTVLVGGPWLLVAGETVKAIVFWPYAAVYLAFFLVLDRIDGQSSSYRYMSALGWFTLAAQGWVISGSLLTELTENPMIRGPVHYLFATLPAALAASFSMVQVLRLNAGRTIESGERSNFPRRLRSEPAEG